MKGYNDRHYGLAGQTVRAKLKDEESRAYPWAGEEVPVLITEERSSYLVGTVLPHRNPFGWDISWPYTITISKHDIYIGEIIINGGKVR